MLRYTNVLLHLILAAIFVSADDSDLIDMATEIELYEKVQTTLALTNTLLDKAADNEVKMTLFESMVMYGTAATYIISATKQLVDLMLLFRPGKADSPELEALKRGFAKVNTKLDALDFEFEDIKNLVDWNTVRINVAELETTILSLEMNFKLFLKAPSDARPALQRLFIDTFHREFTNAPEKIYLALVAQKGDSIFLTNVLETMRQQFANDPIQVAHVGSLLMRTIQRGLTLHAAFLSLTNNSLEFDEIQADWKKRFQHIGVVARQVEDRMNAAWSTQYRIDVDKFVSKQAEITDNNKLGTGLYALLSRKFPHRSWLVIVYTYTNNNDNERYFDNCGQYVKVNVGGKVVIVTSRPRDQKTSWHQLHNVFRQVAYYTKVYGPFTKLAKTIFELPDSFDCRFYRFKGVFAAKAQVVTKGKFDTYLQRITYARKWFHFTKLYYMIAY